MMTTMAAIFGALPLMLATGAGVEMRQPLGITIVGGLVLSQILTLYTTPVVYLYLDRFRLWPRAGAVPAARRPFLQNIHDPQRQAVVFLLPLRGAVALALCALLGACAAGPTISARRWTSAHPTRKGRARCRAGNPPNRVTRSIAAHGGGSMATPRSTAWSSA